MSTDRKVLLDVDPNHRASFLDGELDESSRIILRPRVTTQAESAPVDKHKDGKRLFLLFRCDDVEIQTLCKREFELVAGQCMLDEIKLKIARCRILDA